MSKKRALSKKEMATALFGDEDNIISPSEVDQFLTACGIDPDRTSSEFIHYLERRIIETDDPMKVERLQLAVDLMNTASPIGKQSEPKTDSRFWTNGSVKKLSRGLENPIEIITAKCRDLIFGFSESGGTVAPLDPFALAESMPNVRLVPLEIVPDARTRTVDGVHILEFNPNRPYSRVRYSVCHEIVHTLFPDCGEKTRNRATHEQMESDDWQLEMLCNIGAGELLMPFDELPGELQERVPGVEDILEVRRKFHVSIEAVFLRIARVSRQPFCVFSASRREPAQTYAIDYMKASHNWKNRLPAGASLPPSSVVKNCTAIGHTDHGVEKWPGRIGEVRVECVGISPYQGRQVPRVMGIISAPDPELETTNAIRYIRGDATRPGPDGHRIIAHIVNDKTPNWGGPFARALRQRWPVAQSEFIEWAKQSPSHLSLGSVHLSSLTQDLSVATMVCQHGYGDTAKPRLRYGKLQDCLQQLARIAAGSKSSVHMPRIGSGQAGGDWNLIAGLIEEILCSIGVVVTVYTLPNAEINVSPQGSLFGR
jgi:O-acetyl-ADP-ribose deacetylase (regulator of RNase III)